MKWSCYRQVDQWIRTRIRAVETVSRRFLMDRRAVPTAEQRRPLCGEAVLPGLRFFSFAFSLVLIRFSLITLWSNIEIIFSIFTSLSAMHAALGTGRKGEQWLEALKKERKRREIAVVARRWVQWRWEWWVLAEKLSGSLGILSGIRRTEDWVRKKKPPFFLWLFLLDLSTPS